MAKFKQYDKMLTPDEQIEQLQAQIISLQEELKRQQAAVRDAENQALMWQRRIEGIGRERTASIELPATGRPTITLAGVWRQTDYAGLARPFALAVRLHQQNLSKKSQERNVNNDGSEKPDVATTSE